MVILLLFGRKVIALSLLERLGGRLEHIVYNEFKDDDFFNNYHL